MRCSWLLSYLVSIGNSHLEFVRYEFPPLVIIKFLQPAPVQLPTAPDEPLRDLSSRSDSTRRSTAKTRAPSSSHSPKFDLSIARISLVLDIVALLVMMVASSGTLFACGGFLQALGVGYSPAVQAFALEIYSRRGGKGEAGKLFGAISVVQALG